MVIIGKTGLIFDFVYIFGEKHENRYIELPENCGEENEFSRSLAEIKNNPGKVVVCTQNEQKMKKRYLEMGLLSGRDYYFFSDLQPVFLAMQQKNGVTDQEALYLWETYQKIFSAPHGRYRPCHHPLYEAEITENGDIYTCCSAIMPFTIGNIRDTKLKTVWHSARAKLLRLSLLNGTAVFCSREKCANLQPCRGKPDYHAEQVSDYPLILNLAADATCNLSCPSCRTHVIGADPQEIQEKERWLSNVEKELYPNLRHLYIAGNGECMVSRVYRDYISDRVIPYFSGQLHLVTNGQIWNEELLNAVLSAFRPEVLISVDAWKKETYETLRRGGLYENILANIQKYVQLKKEKYLSCVVVRFVVQTANYQEIPEFIDGMRALGADRMEFTRLVNGPSFAPGEFQRSSLLDELGSLKEPYLSFFEEKIWPRLGPDIAADAAFLPGRKA